MPGCCLPRLLPRRRAVRPRKLCPLDGLGLVRLQPEEPEHRRHVQRARAAPCSPPSERSTKAYHCSRLAGRARGQLSKKARSRSRARAVEALLAVPRQPVVELRVVYLRNSVSTRTRAPCPQPGLWSSRSCPGGPHGGCHEDKTPFLVCFFSLCPQGFGSKPESGGCGPRLAPNALPTYLLRAPTARLRAPPTYLFPGRAAKQKMPVSPL